jgi:hypothetical protein
MDTLATSEIIDIDIEDLLSDESEEVDEDD